MDHDLTIALRARTAHIIAYRFQLQNERHRNMSRLSEKLKMASGVVGRQTARIEAKADAIIAREPELEKQTDNAFALHDALLNDAARGLDALERELALVSNDPLGSSGESSQERQTTDRVALGPHPDVPEGQETASQQDGSASASADPGSSGADVVRVRAEG
jgi:hypothetical protein